MQIRSFQSPYRTVPALKTGLQSIQPSKVHFGEEMDDDHPVQRFFNEAIFGKTTANQLSEEAPHARDSKWAVRAKQTQDPDLNRRGDEVLKESGQKLTSIREKYRIKRENK